MKKYISLIMAAIAWFAVIIQFYIMLENRTASILETCIRFFSFFTILTNSLVALYFTLAVSQKKNKATFIEKPGTLTALTVYITIVGLVYQILLRPIWDPTGLQMLVDELLHSVIPVLVIVFWYFYEVKKSIAYNQVPRWLIYPLVYLVFILIRGYFSGYYPYPFTDVVTLGLTQVLVNSIGLMLLFVGLSVLLIKIGKVISKSN